MKNMDLLFLLRFIHITGAFIWVGSVITMALFILPAINASGPEGGKVMQKVARTNAYPVVINTAATLTILSGLFLIWKISGGFQSTWLSSVYGVLLTTGGVLGIAAYSIGFVVNRPSVARITALGQEIALAGGVPSPQQVQEINAIRQKMFTATRVSAALLASAILIMELSRYI